MGFFSKLFGEPDDPDKRSAPQGAKEVDVDTPLQLLAGKKIALVQKSITIQKVIELTVENATLVSEQDGARAAEKLRSEKFDLVIAGDFDQVSSYDLCAIVKSAHGPAAPVMLLRHTFEKFDDKRAREVKADSVLLMPFDPKTFLREVGRILRTTKPPEVSG